MDKVRRGIGTALVVAVIIFFLGWYYGAHHGDDGNGEFESCRFDGDILRLSWTYGAGDTVSPQVEQHRGEIEVSLEIDHADNMPDVGLIGRATFAIYGDQDVVRYPDGDELECRGRAASDD